MQYGFQMQDYHCRLDDVLKFLNLGPLKSQINNQNAEA